MSEINDGGPAFPCAAVYDSENDTIERADEYVDLGGMSLRDYFAGQALIGLFAAANHPQHCGIARKDYGDAGSEAYELADAMLAARDQS